ncbi:uncharacterized protein LOC113225712 [Hyposmocoma kahamanoa]|uniref:uncharacterized protein LOC113225712 n=1 Tax=Hyposmocoma kahamanoa TaxID=1477025 RepID=UPI000E6D7D62|nr:uncharacterized protein LOC113225712 [Hyposmocoma kahamanoa]
MSWMRPFKTPVGQVWLRFKGKDKDGVPGKCCYAAAAQGECDEFVSNTCAVKGEKWKQLYLTLTAVEDLFDVFQHYDVNTCIFGSAMSVMPKHRGQNIGARLIEASENLCKTLKVGAICTSYTALTSQALASKCGHELLAEMPYERMLEQGIDLRQCETKTVQLRGKKIL